MYGKVEYRAVFVFSYRKRQRALRIDYRYSIVSRIGELLDQKIIFRLI